MSKHAHKLIGCRFTSQIAAYIELRGGQDYIKALVYSDWLKYGFVIPSASEGEDEEEEEEEDYPSDAPTIPFPAPIPTPTPAAVAAVEYAI